MVIDEITPMQATQTPAIISQAELDKYSRADMIDVARMSGKDFKSLTQVDLDELPVYKQMWFRIFGRVLDDKPDMRAAEFIQEHLAGKAVQKTEAKIMSVTYQDLLKNVQAAEQRYVEVVAQPLLEMDYKEDAPLSLKDLL